MANPITGNAESELKIPSSWANYLPSANYTAADVAAKATAGYGYTPAPQVARPNVKTPWATPTLYAPDPLRAAVEAATGGRVTVLYDDQGNPSYMCIIPKFKVEDIHADLGTGVHPAFIVGGVEKPYIMIAQNLASQIGSRAVSLPGKDPWCSLAYDAAKTACTSKGTGWHMMTNWEWAAVTLWMLKNGFQPRGNSNYGRAHDALHETAPRQDGLAPGTASGTARNGCGLGPAGWRHDNTPVGIADLVGNVWEWQDGLKLVDGQFVMPNDNEYTLAEGSWPTQGVFLDSSGTTGTDTVASGNGAPQLSASRLVPSDDCGDGLGSSAPDYDYTSIGGDTGWRTVALTTGYDGLALATRQKMMQAMVAAKLTQATAAPYSANGYISCRNYGERIPIRGGVWDFGSLVGVAALLLYYLRSIAYDVIGFRPAFLP